MFVSLRYGISFTAVNLTNRDFSPVGYIVDVL